jgi:hypothetical protein
VNTIKQTDIKIQLTSHLVVLCGLDKFLNALKKTLHLTSDYIKSAITKSRNVTKNSLQISVTVMQNRKWAEDQLIVIQKTLEKVTESEELNKKLKEKQIVLETPAPDFNVIRNELNNKKTEIEELIKLLNNYENQQEKINKEFVVKCRSFEKEVKDIYKKAGVEFIEKDFAAKSSEIIDKLKDK